MTFDQATLSSLQPVPKSDREVLARLRNCVLALAECKMLLFDTCIIYAYETSLKYAVSNWITLTPLFVAFFF